MNELQRSSGTQALAPSEERVSHYTRSSKAASTHRAYTSGWADFTRFCTPRGYQAPPATPETVAAYIAHLADAGKRPATIDQRLAAIAFAHKLAEQQSPTTHPLVTECLAGIKRSLGTAQRRAAPATTDVVRGMVGVCDESPMGIRDRALVLVGFAGAFRESELAALTVADIAYRAEGMAITLRHSKTDQEGRERVVGIVYGTHPETCPVRALRRYLEVFHIEDGPVFRATRGVNAYDGAMTPTEIGRTVKRLAKQAGYDAARFSGHSLRAGLVTSAAKARVPTHRIMDHTGHQNEGNFRRYIREADLFLDNASASVGL